jgi:hypothetical protein
MECPTEPSRLLAPITAMDLASKIDFRFFVIVISDLQFNTPAIFLQTYFL